MKHEFLASQRPLPDHHTEHRVVQWHVFRDVTEAGDYADHIQLSTGQTIVGGFDSDSIGTLWWIGVEVDDLASWGNRSAVNKHAE